jgi:hypothetical protein
MTQKSKPLATDTTQKQEDSVLTGSWKPKQEKEIVPCVEMKVRPRVCESLSEHITRWKIVAAAKILGKMQPWRGLERELELNTGRAPGKARIWAGHWAASESQIEESRPGRTPVDALLAREKWEFQTMNWMPVQRTKGYLDPNSTPKEWTKITSQEAKLNFSLKSNKFITDPRRSPHSLIFY